MRYYNLKDALKEQSVTGGTIWYDALRKAYYIV